MLVDVVFKAKAIADEEGSVGQTPILEVYFSVWFEVSRLVGLHGEVLVVFIGRLVGLVVVAGTLLHILTLFLALSYALFLFVADHDGSSLVIATAQQLEIPFDFGTITCTMVYQYLQIFHCCLELLPPSHVFTHNQVSLFDDLSDVKQTEPTPYQLMLEIVEKKGLFLLEFLSLFGQQREADFGTPLDRVRMNFFVGEIPIFDEVNAISTDICHIRQAAIILICFLPIMLVLFRLRAVFMAGVGDIDARVVEKLAKGHEIRGVHEGSKTSADSVGVDPGVVLFGEELTLQERILIPNLIEGFPLAAEVFTLHLHRINYRLVLESLQLLVLPH